MNTPEDTPPPTDASVSAAPVFSEGQKLAGVFVLRREVHSVPGERIWLAHDEILGKDVSLHFIPETLRTDERAMSELRAEVKKNRQLIHQGILRVYDFIEENGWAAISMDWFEGESIASLQQKKGGSGFAAGEIEPWLRQVCQTLDQVHKIPVLHRNLSPANLFLNESGKLLIAKFGVSRAMEEAKGRLRDRSLGPDAALAWLSPQQLDGETPNKLDDIYGLGVTLYELLTGALPFQGEDLVSQIRRAPAPSPAQSGAQVPPAWEKIIAACLAKDSAARPQTAGAVGQALDLGGKGTTYSTAAPVAVVASAVRREKAAPTPQPASNSPAPRVLPEPEIAPASETPVEREPARERRKLPSAVEEPVPAHEKEAEEIYPELEHRTGSPMTTVAVIAALAAIAGGFVYFNHRGGNEPTPGEPVNDHMAASATPEAGPEPSATPLAPVRSTPASIVAVASTPKATPAPATPGALLPGEPILTEETLPPASGIAQASALDHGAKLTSITNVRKPPGRDGETSSAPPTAATPAVAPVPPRASTPVSSALPATPTATPFLLAKNKATPAPEKAPATPEPKVSIPVIPTSSGPITAADLPTKQAQFEKAKDAGVAADKVYQDTLTKKQSAEAALAAAQKGVDDKIKAMGPVVAAAEALQTEQKKREEAAKAAETAAREARQSAEDLMRQADQKARQSEDAKKGLTDWQLLNKEKLSGRDKVEGELTALKGSLTEKQQSAAALAKAAADAETVRTQALATLDRADKEVAAAQVAVEQERQRQIAEEKEKEKKAIQKQIEDMKRTMDELMKKAQQLDGGSSSAPAPPAAAPISPTSSVPQARAPIVSNFAPATPAPATPKVVAAPPAPVTPAAVVIATPAPATPAPQIVKTTPATPPLSLLGQATPTPATPPPTHSTLPPATPVQVVMASTPAPVLPPPLAPPLVLATPPPLPATPAPSGSSDKSSYENSLGLKFAPVGDVMFAIWPTRLQDFEIFAQEANVKNTAWRSPGFKQGPTHPVVNVSWIDAMAFCKWLTDKEHKKNILPKEQIYRLPTDLEWSRAVGLSEEQGKTPMDRDMGVPDVFPWGTQWPPPPNVGNYTGEETNSEVAIKGYDDGFQWTAPVGSFPPNKYGLYDMGGNVWQWCMDNWSADSKSKVLRGASWYNGALKLSLLSSCRVKANPESSTDNYGFRIVRAEDTTGLHRSH